MGVNQLVANNAIKTDLIVTNERISDFVQS